VRPPRRESLGVVVPATDAPATLQRCLRAIERADDRPDELVVVDSPPDAGPAEARNAGAERLSTDLLGFVDADVEVRADAFVRIRERFASDAGLEAVFGSYDDDPAERDPVSLFRNLLHHHVHQTGAGEAGTFWTGLGAVRADAFSRVGGFGPSTGVEDVELGMRLAGAGARIELDADIQGKHLKRWTLAGMVRTDFAARGVPWVRAVLREGRGAGDLNLGGRHRLGVAASLTALAGALARRPATAAAGLIALAALNRPLYELLWRRGGPRAAAAGLALHVLHHATGTAAVPLAVASHYRLSTSSR
jgi:hypothetical protein